MQQNFIARTKHVLGSAVPTHSDRIDAGSINGSGRLIFSHKICGVLG